MKRLLIVAPYPYGKAPSQRFRFEQYLDFLRGQGLACKVASFWSKRHWPDIYHRGNLPLKIYATLEGFVRRFFLLFTLHRYHKVLIHREATPLGPPWWEWAAAKIWQKQLIYDYDDAVWLPNSSAANEKYVGRFKAHSKTSKIIGWSSAVMAGNEFLASYARQHCKEVHVIPTSIDTDRHHCRIKQHSAHREPVIGWTGSHSTLRQLTPIFPLLIELQAKKAFRFVLISDEAPPDMPPFVSFVKWNKEREIEDLVQLDVGIMPLYDTDWERGKCGFKALQYMALGIPAVGSDVGVNPTIIDHATNGYLCEKMPLEEHRCWMSSLLSLISNAELRTEMGRSARQKIERDYSVKSLRQRYLDILG